MADHPSTNDLFVETQAWITQTFRGVPQDHPHWVTLIELQQSADSAMRAGISQAQQILRVAMRLRGEGQT